jgi:hypothetical protein
MRPKKYMKRSSLHRWIKIGSIRSALGRLAQRRKIDAPETSGHALSGKLVQTPPIPPGGFTGSQHPSLSVKALSVAMVIVVLLALGGGWWMWRQVHPDRTALVNTSPERKGNRRGASASASGHQPPPAELAGARAAESAKIAGETGDAKDLVNAGSDRVFGIADGALLRNFVGRNVTFQGVLRSVRDSSSGKTRYLEFSDDRGVDDVCGHLWIRSANADLSKPALAALIHRKLAICGKVEIESSTGRVVIHITDRKQISEPPPGK